MAKSKSKSVYTCQKCGAQRPKWLGQCPECNSWNSFVEETYSAAAAEPRGWTLGKSQDSVREPAEAQRLHEIQPKNNSHRRILTGISEFDRVLGGGIVPGSYVLVGGDPGIGKSTLLLQMAGNLSAQLSVLYVSGEESVDQTSLRAKRLGVKGTELFIAAEGQLEKILDLVQKVKPSILVVDSIQTIFLSDLESAPGSVSQVRECAGRLMTLAKSSGISVFLVGHVTKDGHLAGPKVLEHMVDAVLSFEGDSSYSYRLLRSLKNRFGTTHELGVFQMNSEGLQEVLNPSELFLSDHQEAALGSCLFALIEGSRPLLCEVQALTNTSPMPVPRRTTVGWDTNRLHLLAAVLERHAGVMLSQREIYVNIVGGLKIQEPAADLAVAASLVSSERSFMLSSKTVLFGEVGLTGEVRPVHMADLRVKESLKLGFRKFVLPRRNKTSVEGLFQDHKDAEVIWIDHIQKLPDTLKQLSPRYTPNAQGASATSKAQEDFI